MFFYYLLKISRSQYTIESWSIYSDHPSPFLERVFSFLWDPWEDETGVIYPGAAAVSTEAVSGVSGGEADDLVDTVFYGDIYDVLTPPIFVSPIRIVWLVFYKHITESEYCRYLFVFNQGSFAGSVRNVHFLEWHEALESINPISSLQYQIAEFGITDLRIIKSIETEWEFFSGFDTSENHKAMSD